MDSVWLSVAKLNLPKFLRCNLQGLKFNQAIVVTQPHIIRDGACDVEGNLLRVRWHWCYFDFCHSLLEGPFRIWLHLLCSGNIRFPPLFNPPNWQIMAMLRNTIRQGRQKSFISCVALWRSLSHRMAASMSVVASWWCAVECGRFYAVAAGEDAWWLVHGDAISYKTMSEPAFRYHAHRGQNGSRKG